MIKNVFVLILILLSSCARILNKKHTNVKIYVEKPTQVIFQNDTISVNNSLTLTPLRSKDSLKFTTITNDSTKQHTLPAINSLAYYLNIANLSVYGIGFILDGKKPKRYAYPYKIWIKNQKALDFKHKNPDFNFQNIISLSLTDFISTDGLTKATFGYQRRLNNLLSTNINISLLTQNSYLENLKGYKVNLEQKLYFKKNAPIGSYLAFGVSGLTSIYKIDLNFIDEAKEFIPLPWYANFFFPFLIDYDNRTYTEKVSIEKNVFSTSVVYGKNYKLINRFFVDANIGLGLRYTDLKHINRRRPQDNIKKSKLFFLNESNVHKERKNWSYYIPLNVKLGYSF